MIARLKLSTRLLVPAHARQHGAAIVQDARIVRRQRQRAVEAASASSSRLEPGKCVAASEMGGRPGRPQGKRAVEALKRLIEALELDQCRAAVGVASTWSGLIAMARS